MIKMLRTTRFTAHHYFPVLIILMTACGPNRSSGPLANAIAEPVPAPSESSAVMPSDLRAAYNVSVQRAAPKSYAAMAFDGLVRMENSAQGFVATVNRRGLTIAPNQGRWHWVMHSVAVGCEGVSDALADTLPEATGNRIDFRHEGLTEWYLNGPLGVEHGFVMHDAPACAGLKRIVMAIEGDLAANLNDADGDGRGDAVRFVDAEGRTALSYTDLFVTDATGKTVPAWLSVNGNEVAVVVDDSGTTYPITIDPLIRTEQVKLVASQGGEGFGWSVSLSGDTALVGSYRDRIGENQTQGSAYIFVRDGSTWSKQAKLVAPDGAESELFGYSVSLEGDTAFVGSPYSDIAPNKNQGSVYVFTRSGTAWTQQAKLTASDGETDDKFGIVVSHSENRALVGTSPTDINGYVEAGAVYVFVRNGTAWTQEAKLVASDGTTSDVFGAALSLSSDTALVGAFRSDIGANVDQGSVYVYLNDGFSWNQQAKLVADDGTANDQFGGAVALSGDTALVGAFGGNDHQGSAHVFVRNGTTWSRQTRLTSDDSSGTDRFGASVAVSGDTAVVGAFTDTIGQNVFQGSAYLFARNGTTWTQEAKLFAADGTEFDLFGHAVSVSGNEVLVGAEDGKGAAYVFTIEETIANTGSNGAECEGSCTCRTGPAPPISASSQLLSLLGLASFIVRRRTIRDRQRRRQVQGEAKQIVTPLMSGSITAMSILSCSRATW